MYNTQESEVRPVKKLLLFLAVMCACIAIPAPSFTEDSATVRLARTIYALAADEPYETKLAIGSVVMNRVDSPWYPSTLEEVLAQQQQFPCGTRYDEESLAAAHDVISGQRTLSPDAIAYQSKDASAPRGDENKCAESGSYNFYNADLRTPL